MLWLTAGQLAWAAPSAVTGIGLEPTGAVFLATYRARTHFVERYRPDGIFDPAFNQGARLALPFDFLSFAPSFVRIAGTAVSPNSTFYILGEAGRSSSSSDYYEPFISAFTPTGERVPWSVGGRVANSLLLSDWLGSRVARQLEMQSLSVDAAGRVWMVAMNIETASINVFRFVNQSPDRTFGTSGFVNIPIHGDQKDILCESITFSPLGGHAIISGSYHAADVRGRTLFSLAITEEGRPSADFFGVPVLTKQTRRTEMLEDGAQVSGLKDGKMLAFIGRSVTGRPTLEILDVRFDADENQELRSRHELSPPEGSGSNSLLYARLGRAPDGNLLLWNFRFSKTDIVLFYLVVDPTDLTERGRETMVLGRPSCARSLENI